MEVDGSPYCYSMVYYRANYHEGICCDIATIVTTGGSSEDIEFLYVTQGEPAANTMFPIDKSVRMIDLTGQDHVILGKTDSDVSNIVGGWQSITYPTGDEIADTGGSLDHDGTNTNRINNIAGEEITVLAGLTFMCDRSAATNGTRKTPAGRMRLNGTAIDYMIASEYSRGSQSSVDTWIAGASYMAPVVIPSGQYIESQIGDLASNAAADLIINATDGAAVQFWAIRLDDLGGSAPTTVNSTNATATFTAQATTTVLGTRTVASTNSTATFVAQATTVQLGAISADSTNAAATFVAQPTTIVLGTRTVASTNASVNFEAQAGSTDPGAISADSTNAAITFVAQETSNILTVNTAVATITFAAQATIPGWPYVEDFEAYAGGNPAWDNETEVTIGSLTPAIGNDTVGTYADASEILDGKQGIITYDNDGTHPSAIEQHFDMDDAGVTYSVEADLRVSLLPNDSIPYLFFANDTKGTAGDCYGVMLRPIDDGKGSFEYDLTLERRVSGTWTSIQTLAVAYSNGIVNNLRVRVDIDTTAGGGSDNRINTSWWYWDQQASFTAAVGDATYLDTHVDRPSGGFAGVGLRDETSADGAATLARFDNFRVDNYLIHSRVAPSDPNGTFTFYLGGWSPVETEVANITFVAQPTDFQVDTAVATIDFAAQETAIPGGTITVNTAVATIDFAAQVTDTVPGAISADSTNSTITYVAQATTVVPGAISADSTNAVATFVAQPTTAALGAVSADSTNSTITFVAQPTTITLGTRTVSSTNADITFAAQLTTVDQGGVVADTTNSTITFVAQPTTVVPGTVTAASTNSTINFVAQPTDVDIGQVVATAVATISFAAQLTEPFHPINSIGWDAAYWTEGTEFIAESYGDGDDVDVFPDEVGTEDITENAAVWNPDYEPSDANFNNRPSIVLPSASGRMHDNNTYNLAHEHSIVAVARHNTGTITADENLVADQSTLPKIWADYKDGGPYEWGFAAKSGADTGPGTTQGGAHPVDSDAHLFVCKSGASDGFIAVDNATRIVGDAGEDAWSQLKLGIGDFSYVFIGIYPGDVRDAERYDELIDWLEHQYALDYGLDTDQAVIAFVAQATTVVAGDVEVDTAVANITFAAQNSAPTIGGLIVNTAAATADFVAQPTTTSVGAISVDTAVANITFAAQVTDTVPGTRTVASTNSTIDFAAQVTATDSSTIVDSTNSTITFVAQPTDADIDVTIDTDVSTITFAAQATDVDVAEEVDTANANITFVAQDTWTVVGPITTTSTNSTVDFAAQQTSVSLGTRFVQTLVSTLSLSALETSTEFPRAGITFNRHAIIVESLITAVVQNLDSVNTIAVNNDTTGVQQNNDTTSVEVAPHTTSVVVNNVVKEASLTADGVTEVVVAPHTTSVVVNNGTTNAVVNSTDTTYAQLNTDGVTAVTVNDDGVRTLTPADSSRDVEVIVYG